MMAAFMGWFGTGCHQSVETPGGVTNPPVAQQKSVPAPAAKTAPPEAEEVKLYQDTPLTGLPVLKLFLGSESLDAELALGVKEFSTGMMYRKEIADDAAMLFVYGWPTDAAFYMKNTYVPLSCAYIDSEGTILEIYDLEPLNEESVVSKSDNVRYVLEVKQGWFAKHHIGVGTVITSERGTLLEVFPME